MMRVVSGLKNVKPGRSPRAWAAMANPAAIATAATKSSADGLIGRPG